MSKEDIGSELLTKTPTVKFEGGVVLATFPNVKGV